MRWFAGTNNDGYAKEGITFPNTELQLALEKQVCFLQDLGQIWELLKKQE